MTFKTSIIKFSAIFAVVLGAAVANAGIITVTNDATGTARAGFGGNDIMDWTTVGADLSNQSNPFNAVSDGGLNLTVSQAGTSDFERRTNGATWGGNFTDGNDLLWTRGSNAPVDILFASAISGIGFQINPDFSNTMTNVEIFNAANVSLGSFSLVTNDRSESSASFIGFTSSMVDISRISISMGSPDDFAINQLSLITNGVAVAEPGTLALIGLGLVGLGMARRRKSV